MHVTGVAWHNLLRRPARSALTALGIAAAVGGFVAMVGLARSVGHAWTSHLNDRGVHVFAVKKGTVEILATSLDANLAGPISAVEGVRQVDGELIDLVPMPDGPTGYVSGWRADGFLNQSLPMSAGKRLQAGQNDACVLGESIAKALGKQVGDAIQLRDREFRVAGIFRRESVLASNSIIIPLSQLQQMMGRPGKVTAFNLRLNQPADRAATESTIASLSSKFPELAFLETSAVAEQDRMLRLMRAIAWGFSAVAVAIGAVVMLNTLLTAVVERTREIGVLTALGWSAGRILGLIVIEGLILSAVGSLVGLGVGLAGLHWIVTSSAIRGFLEPEVSWRLIGEVLLAAIGLALAGSLYPAWRAVRLNVVEALRYE
jgi:putative ABC transport system permease protein